jgi:hypothetical protein
MRTFFAPAARCLAAVALSRKRPVDSTHDVGADFVPLQFGGIFDGGEADLFAIDDQRVAVDRDVALEAAVHRVVLAACRPGSRVRAGR